MVKSRTKNSLINIVMSFLNQFTNLILSFISRTIFIKFLGVEFLGINGLFSDVLTLLSMADLGFNTAMVYSFYRPIAENNTKKITALINFYKRIYRIIAINITIIGILITPFIDKLVNTPNNIPLLKLYYLISLAGVVISYLFVYKTSIIIADQRNYIITKINIIVNFIKTIMQIVILILFKNYSLFLLINLFGNFINNYIASKKAVKLYPYINGDEVLERKEKREIYTNIKSIFVYKLSSLLINATDNTIISVIIGTITVGIYSNYLLIVNKALAIIQVIFASLTASIGNVIIKEKNNKKYEIFKATQSISCIICGIVVSSFCILINDFVRIWLGDQYVFNYIVILAITLNLYLSCILQPLWTYREATGLYMKTKYIMFIAAIINLILSIILGKILGIAGVLFASAISRLTTYFWYEPFLLFKDYFDVSIKKFYTPIIINFLIVIFNICFVYTILSKINVNSWKVLILKGSICLIFSSVIFLLAYFKSEGFKHIINKLKFLLKS